MGQCDTPKLIASFKHAININTNETLTENETVF